MEHNKNRPKRVVHTAESETSWIRFLTSKWSITFSVLLIVALAAIGAATTLAGEQRVQLAGGETLVLSCDGRGVRVQRLGRTEVSVFCKPHRNAPGDPAPTSEPPASDPTATQPPNDPAPTEPPPTAVPTNPPPPTATEPPPTAVPTNPPPTATATAVPPTPPPPNPDGRGNVVACGQMWCWEDGTAFTPQLVMFGGPHVYWTGSGVDTAAIDAEIQRFIVEHGFNGFHVPVFCRWWNIETTNGRCTNGMTGPDQRTFDVLGELLARTDAAGGMVHFWMYGDSSRGQNPVGKFGAGSATEHAVLDTIAAQLGPLDGWTIGYGYDLFEWASSSQIEAWHTYLQTRMPQTHLTGARGTKNAYSNWSNLLGYYSVEWHHPSYQDYRDHLANANGRPAFSEDRFRLNSSKAKHYSMEETRRGLWHSTLAGGVANIWGYMEGVDSDALNMGDMASPPYPNPEQIRTYADFWNGRFNVNMTVCGEYCLSDGAITVLYGEDTNALNFSGTAVAVDTLQPYQEIQVSDGALPYVSDWAVVIGE